jgi:hypothetical protein
MKNQGNLTIKLISETVKNENFSFDFCFEINFKGEKDIRKGDAPLPPLVFACRARYFWFASQNASLSKDTTTNPKNLVSQIAFGKRFANSWFCFAKLKFCLRQTFKTRPHLNICLQQNIYFCFAKTVNAFFGLVVVSLDTHDRQTPPAPL